MTPDEIKEIRTNLDITQEKFASIIGATVVTVNRWETGKCKPSRLYVKEMKELRKNSGSYICRRKKFENT